MKYICTHCGVEKDESMFNRLSGRKRKVSYWCKECYKINRELVREKEKTIPTKKTCTMCNTEKAINAFYINRHTSTGYMAACKECVDKKNKEWRENNTEAYKKALKKHTFKNKSKKAIYDKEYRQKNIDKIKEYKRRQYIEYKKEIDAGLREKQVKDKERYREYFRKRRETDISYKLRCAVRGRLRGYIKGKSVSKKVIELTGCNMEELRNHIESQFKDGMSWDNYGGYRNNGWNIDHIKPCSMFDFTKEEQLKECFHYTNLQPLWWNENISKGNKWEQK